MQNEHHTNCTAETHIPLATTVEARRQSTTSDVDCTTCMFKHTMYSSLFLDCVHLMLFTCLVLYHFITMHFHLLFRWFQFGYLTLHLLDV